jgi:hypothetical protein
VTLDELRHMPHFVVGVDTLPYFIGPAITFDTMCNVVEDDVVVGHALLIQSGDGTPHLVVAGDPDLVRMRLRVEL